VSTGTEEGKGHGLLTLADSAGVPAGTLGTPAFVWLSEQGVEVRFASGLGEPGGDAAEASGRVLVGPGEGKSSLQIASAGGAVGVAWQEVSADGHGVIKLRGVSQDSGLLGSEITVGGTAGTLSHHSLSISGYGLNADATGGLNLVWVASDATDAPGVGRIMMQRFGVSYDEGGTPAGLIPVDMVGQAFHKISHASELETGFAGAANDNSVWIGDDDGSGGAVGRLPTVATLDTGDVLVAWIGSEGHVHGKLYATAPTGDAAAPDYGAVNEALADLTPHYGRAGDGHAWDARRVKVGDLGPGNFALVWLVAAGADAMLNGSVFSLRADETLASGASSDWVQTPMAPVALPVEFTGEFNLNVADGHASDLVLSYEVADSAGNVSIAAVAQKIGPADTTLGGKDVAPDLSAPDKVDPGMAAAKVAFNGSSGNPFLAGDQHASIVVNTNSLAGNEPATAAHSATPTETAADEASKLIVSSNSDGIATALMVESVLTLKFPDSDASGANENVIEVTDSADPDVTPAVARIGDGGAVAAWVDAHTGELRAQTYNAHGQPQGSLTVAAGQKVSDIALASNPAGHHAAAADGAAEPQASATGEAAATDHAPIYDIEFAMAWVLGANENGYGSIMLQRYWVTSNSEGAGAGNALVALGRDGQVGGDNDEAAQFSVDGHDGVAVPVYGRAPQLTGLPQGQLAIGWVENDGAQETVKGAVIERDGGREVLNIDLSEQLDVPAVVAKGTHPIITSAANGDILVAWLEPDGSDGFDLKAAIYKVAGEEAWSVPDKVLELQHFTSQPKDFSLGLTGDNDPSILLTWENDSNSIWGQRFDLNGDQLGNSFGIRDGHPDEVSDTTSLPDGRIVVVYAEQDSNGNVDVESHVVITGDDSQSGSYASDGSDHIFGDRGALDTHAGLGDYGSLSDASPLANDKDITVAEDATDGVIIDVLNDQVDTNLRVVQVNGADLAIGAPLRVEHGFVQLRDDGDLLFTADEHFHGTINFEYTVSNEDDQLATASVAINVTPVEDDPMPVDLAFDQASEHTSLADASAIAYNGHDGGSGPDLGPGLGDADGSSHDGGSETDQDRAADTGGEGDRAEAEHHGAQGADHQPQGEAHAYAYAYGHDRHEAASLAAGDAEDGHDGSGSQAPLASMEDAGDTIAFAARYESSYRPGSVERQWLQLDLDAIRGAGDAAGTDAGYGQGGDPRPDNDTFVFHAAFGNDAAIPEARGVDHVIDLSKSGYPTFQALQDAGALVQVGEDVEITLSVTDPSHPEKVLLRSVNLSTLTASDFKFG
jgi:Bacterial Ig domain